MASRWKLEESLTRVRDALNLGANGVRAFEAAAAEWSALPGGGQHALIAKARETVRDSHVTACARRAAQLSASLGGVAPVAAQAWRNGN